MQGRVGNIVFLFFHAAIPEESVDRSFELIGRSLTRHPSGIGLVAVFGERTRVPTAEMRRRIATYLASVGDQLLIGSTVIEGESLGASVKRVATSMMTTIVKPHYPHKTVRSVPMACDYVARCAVDDNGAPLAQGALFLAATSLRSLIAAAPSVASE